MDVVDTPLPTEGEKKPSEHLHVQLLEPTTELLEVYSVLLPVPLFVHGVHVESGPEGGQGVRYCPTGQGVLEHGRQSLPVELL